MIADQPTNSQDQLCQLLDFSINAYPTPDASTTKIININEPLIDIEFPVSKQTCAFDERDEDIPPLSEITERVNRILVSILIFSIFLKLHIFDPNLKNILPQIL